MAVDLHLFLDTHPTNKEALKDYEKISKQYHMLKKTNMKNNLVLF